jgi:hypothetical protein
MARRRPDSGPKLDSADFEALSSTESPTPNKRPAAKKINEPGAEEYLKNPKLKKTGRLKCALSPGEASGSTHDASHMFTAQGGDEFPLCKEHLDEVVTNAIIKNKPMRQRALTRDDVEPYAQKRRLDMFAQRRVAEEGFKASGLTGSDALQGREKETVGGGRIPHKDNQPLSPTSGKDLAASARKGIHPAEELIAAVEKNGGGHNLNPLRDINIINAKNNRIENPSMYDGAGNRIYDLNNAGKTKRLTVSEKSIEEIRAENHAKRSTAAKEAKNPGRFKPGTNVNPGVTRHPVIPYTGPKEEVDVLEKGVQRKSKIDDKKQLAGIEAAGEAERLRNVERIKTDPQYRKEVEKKAREKAKNKSAPPFTT